jgi:carboxyl-terminal processing protease
MNNGKRRYLGFCFLFILSSFALLSCDLEYLGAVEDAVKKTTELTESADVNAYATLDASWASDVNYAGKERIWPAIYSGNFALARTIVEPNDTSDYVSKELDKIISEYESLQKRREQQRQKIYEQQLEELERLKAAADVNGLGDVNEINKVLSVVYKAAEFSIPEQKKQILEKDFVKQVFAGAKEKASEYEARGKWLDAYTNCYWWLKELDKDNKQYADYAEELIEKAAIVSTFQDSPCETRKERYTGVKDEMFVRAIDSLRYNYVGFLDFRQMTKKALTRCKLLGEVLRYGSEISDIDFEIPQEAKLSAWRAGLSELSLEVENLATGMSRDKFISIFDRVLELNRATAKVPEGFLIAQYSEAALGALDDYTVIVWPRGVTDFQKLMTNEFTGVGIEISKQKGLLNVVSLLADTPAYRSGLDAGDVIEAVDGVPTKDMSINCAVKNITGPAGTEVTLTIRRQGWEQPKDITITRARIIVPTIRGWQRTAPAKVTGGDEGEANGGKWRYIIDPSGRIGYVRITNFSAETSADLEKVLIQLEQEGLGGLILDLRNNTGGFLEAAVDVSNKFLGEGLIVKTVPHFGPATYKVASRPGTHPDYPVVILINSYSASASEIVAGALGDPKNNRAILVGERTHGKGSVQGISQHPGGGTQLKYTMAYYHLPSGQRVESKESVEKKGRSDWGVGPDVEIELTSEEARQIGEVQRSNDVLAQAGHDIEGKPLKKYSLEETLEADAQLSVGLLIVKTKLLEQRMGTAKLN